jgi:uncharacterized membrane protein YhaH (DUF805 family)
MEKDQKMDEGGMASDKNEMREESRPRRYSANWVAGAVFILAGAVILLGNLTEFRLNNWWALFILIPAVGAFTNTYRAYQNEGNRLNASARGSLISGLAMIFMMVVFLFNLDLSLLWPVGLVLVGIGILLSSLVK